MVSDAELVERLREFLRVSDLTTTTTAIVRRRLEEEFGIDLSEKKVFIREQVDLFLQSEVDLDKKDEVDEPVEAEEERGSCGDGDGEMDEEEEGESSDGVSSRKRKANRVDKETKRRGGGFAKVCSLSPQLQKFLGVSELARTEVVKQLWVYIREKQLQDPGNKKTIICDENLQNLFNVKTIDMFQMNKALSKHIWPLNSEDGPAKSTQKDKQQKKPIEDSDEMPKREKRRKGGSSGFLAPLPLSDALMKFIGTGESALPRSDVVKRIWSYIKENNLQDPADKRNILCDEKLKELFNVDSFHGFTVPKLLTAHFVKAEN